MDSHFHDLPDDIPDVNSESYCSFLGDFAYYFDKTEVPMKFALWSALGGISCAVGRNCFIQNGMIDYKLNEYICLVGPSGVKKSTPLRFANKLIDTLIPKPNLIPQSLTMQSLYDAMKDPANTPVDAKQLFKQKHHTGYLFGSEFSNFLNRNSYEAGLPPMLTEMYDGSIVRYQTKSRGVEELIDPCFGMLVGTTIDFIANAFPESAVGGGLTSRILFVYSDPSDIYVPIPRLTDEKRSAWDRMTLKLQRIQQINGMMRFTRTASRFYEEEYVKNKTDDQTLAQFNNPVLRGYLERRGDHLLKIAGLLSLSEREDRVVTIHIIKQAHIMLTEIERMMPKIMHLITSNEQGQLLLKAQLILKTMKKIYKHDAIKLFSNKLTGQQVEQLFATLESMRVCKAHINGTETIYALIEK